MEKDMVVATIDEEVLTKNNLVVHVVVFCRECNRQFGVYFTGGKIDLSQCTCYRCKDKHRIEELEAKLASSNIE